jgi:hypothetical protein
MLPQLAGPASTGPDADLVAPPSGLTDELLAVADRTVEPTMVSLWLRPPMERSARSIL